MSSNQTSSSDSVIIYNSPKETETIKDIELKIKQEELRSIQDSNAKKNNLFFQKIIPFSQWIFNVFTTILIAILTVIAIWVTVQGNVIALLSERAKLSSEVDSLKFSLTSTQNRIKISNFIFESSQDSFSKIIDSLSKSKINLSEENKYLYQILNSTAVLDNLYYLSLDPYPDHIFWRSLLSLADADEYAAQMIVDSCYEWAQSENNPEVALIYADLMFFIDTANEDFFYSILDYCLDLMEDSSALTFENFDEILTDSMMLPQYHLKNFQTLASALINKAPADNHIREYIYTFALFLKNNEFKSFIINNDLDEYMAVISFCEKKIFEEDYTKNDKNSWYFYRNLIFICPQLLISQSVNTLMSLAKQRVYVDSTSSFHITIDKSRFPYYGWDASLYKEALKFYNSSEHSYQAWRDYKKLYEFHIKEEFGVTDSVFRNQPKDFFITDYNLLLRKWCDWRFEYFKKHPEELKDAITNATL